MHIQTWILLESRLDYPVNIFLCASRRGTSIAIYALEGSHAVLLASKSVLVEWYIYRCAEHDSCQEIEAFWVQ
jgi:hypothetical protein